LAYVNVPTATATRAMARSATAESGNSGVGVGVGEAEVDGKVTVLLVGIQMHSRAVPLAVGMKLSVLEV